LLHAQSFNGNFIAVARLIRAFTINSVGIMVSVPLSRSLPNEVITLVYLPRCTRIFCRMF